MKGLVHNEDQRIAEINEIADSISNLKVQHQLKA